MQHEMLDFPSIYNPNVFRAEIKNKKTNKGKIKKITTYFSKYLVINYKSYTRIYYNNS